MDVIESTIDTSEKEFKDNYKNYEKLVKDLKSHIAKAAKGGGDEKIKLHKSRNKMLARERIDALLDPLRRSCNRYRYYSWTRGCNYCK